MTRLVIKGNAIELILRKTWPDQREIGNALGDGQMFECGGLTLAVFAAIIPCSYPPCDARHWQPRMPRVGGLGLSQWASSMEQT